MQKFVVKTTKFTICFANQHIGDQLQVRDPSSNVHLRLDHDPRPIKCDPFALFATPKLSQKIRRKKKKTGNKYFTFFFPKQLAQRSSAGVTNRKWTKVDHVVRIWSWTFWFHRLSQLFYFPRSSFCIIFHADDIELHCIFILMILVDNIINMLFKLCILSFAS